ncbi:MAG: GGDEF domain-containing protein, partial [Acidimicrobiales bacterium]
AQEVGGDGGRPEVGSPGGAPARARALDGRHDPLLAGALPGAVNVVVVPLVVEDLAVGTLAVERGGGAGAQVTARTVDLLSQFGAHAALALRAAALRAQVERLAGTDALTGLANRRVFQESLARELAVAARRGERCGLVVLDVDHFKAVNDTHGHQAGDEVLRLVGRALAEAARETDTAARYGGEEFAVVVPGCATSEAAAVAERLRAAVIATCAAGPVPVTVSAGVASYPADALDGDALVAAADAGLYRAKRLGRNRTVRFRRPRPARTAGRRRLPAAA